MIPVPTWRLAVVAVAAAAVALVVPTGLVGLVVAANVLVVALAAVDYARCVSPSSIEVTRTSPGVLVVDVVRTLEWEVTNLSRRACRAALADDLAPSLRATRRRVGVRLGPGVTVAVATPVRPQRRGRFALDEVVVRVEGPLGLVARQATRDSPGVIRVLPAFMAADDDRALARARVLDVGLRSARGRGGGTEFDQLRDYSPDDEFRRIDWAATARAGRPIARQFRAEQNQTVISLVDNGRVMAGRVAGVARIEHAMDACVTLTTVASQLGDKAGLVAFDRGIRALVPAAAGRGQRSLVTEALYDLEPALAESDYAGVFADVARRQRRRALLVVFTDMVEQAVGEALLPALPLLARRHVVMVAAVTDPQVHAWSQDPVSDETVYRRVAAVATLDERRRARVRLEAAGATVVEAPPGELATGVVATYLRIKATGRL